MLGDFCRWLGDSLHVPVTPHRYPSPDSLASAFGRERVDLAWTSPVLALTSEDMDTAMPLVSSVREGVASYHAVLFTRSDAPFRSPSDLAGVRAAWVARTSAGGYLMPMLALAARGVTPDKAFSVERFVNSHGAVARAVLDGSADVGATYAVFEDGDPTKQLLRSGFLDADPAAEVRVLMASGPIPADLVVAQRKLAITVRAAVVTALEHIADDAEAAAAAKRIFGADGFRRFEPGALDPLRADVDSGRALGLI